MYECSRKSLSGEREIEIVIKIKGMEEREREKSNEATIKKEAFSLCSNMTLNSSYGM